MPQEKEKDTIEAIMEEFNDLGSVIKGGEKMYAGLIDKEEARILLRSALERVREEARQEERGGHIEIYKWLLGYYSFPDLSIKPHYKFREELRKRLPAEIIKSIEEETLDA